MATSSEAADPDQTPSEEDFKERKDRKDRKGFTDEQLQTELFEKRSRTTHTNNNTQEETDTQARNDAENAENAWIARAGRGRPIFTQAEQAAINRARRDMLFLRSIKFRAGSAPRPTQISDSASLFCSKPEENSHNPDDTSESQIKNQTKADTADDQDDPVACLGTIGFKKRTFELPWHQSEKHYTDET